MIAEELIENTVTTLVETSTPFLLAYAIPLLLLSILVTFAGTFLTLDRTRTFAPRTDATDALPGAYKEASDESAVKKWFNSLRFRLDGGVGGMAAGYIFGCKSVFFISSSHISLLLYHLCAASRAFLFGSRQAMPHQLISGRAATQLLHTPEAGYGMRRNANSFHSASRTEKRPRSRSGVALHASARSSLHSKSVF